MLERDYALHSQAARRFAVDVERIIFVSDSLAWRIDTKTMLCAMTLTPAIVAVSSAKAQRELGFDPAFRMPTHLAQEMLGST